ncbi:MAG TPA: response regulator [Pyrinomonadaceae bacterium]|nr:response regulator [Pyrinomonadaceae bacterium]
MPHRILLAEDNADSREVTSLILSRGGFEVVAVPTGRETLALAKELPFDIVLLDYRMPDMTGIEVCHKLREVNPDLPVVFYSAAAFDADKKKAMQCGARAYVTKPEGLLTLPETLQKIIAQRQSEARDQLLSSAFSS